MEKLSSRQKEVYDFIARYFTENGFCPSLADIARGLNLHDSTIAAYVTALKKKGYVTSEYRVARSLRTVDPEKITKKDMSDTEEKETESKNSLDMTEGVRRRSLIATEGVRRRSLIATKE